ncbi:MAG: hypothetical protein R3C58_10830 [Parvularculaceae bacterium]
MTVLITLTKALMLIAAAAITLIAAATMLGIEPAHGKSGGRCAGAQVPACLFVIF